MRLIPLVSGLLVVFGVALGLPACDSPTRPGPVGGSTPPVDSTLVSLQIGGPGTVAPGAAAVQFTATGHYSDGSTRNLTNDPGISWQSSNAQILAISPSGMATGGDRGEATITAAFGGKTAVKSGVFVLPQGTYRLAGTVTADGVPLFGARVEVAQGPATGLVATASPRYELYGVSGDTEILITKDGYRDERRRIQVNSHLTTDVELLPEAVRGTVEGTYTLTVTASAECSGRLPESVRARTFTAVLKQDGSRVTATLEGSTFVNHNGRTYNSFRGTLAGNQLTFYIDDGYRYDWPDVAEVLAPPTFFFMAGSVATDESGRGRRGMLAGVLGVGDAPYEVRRLSWCISNTHLFELERR